MSRFQRYLLMFSAIMALVFIIGIFVVKHPKIRTYIRDTIETTTAESWEGRINVEDIHLSIFPPALILENVQIHRHKADKIPWLTLQKGIIELSPWLKYRGQWILNSIELHQLKGQIDEYNASDAILQSLEHVKHDSYIFKNYSTVIHDN